METINVNSSKREQMIDITDEAQKTVAASGHKDGTESVCRAKYCDGIALDRRLHIGGGQGIPSIESLQALAGSQSCACGSSIQMRQQTS